jgi:hypothetical protein
MLRLLIGTGALLMAVGFGAAGWQYWQSRPTMEPVATAAAATANAPAAKAATRQRWLISPSGGLIAQDDVLAYLAQDRFVEGRTVQIRLQADLSDLLAEGEKLPGVEYLQVLADIRAPRVGEGLCAVMRQSLAADCAVNRARVVKDSVDPATGTALFQLELVFRMQDGTEETPDLAAHVLRTRVAALTPDPGAAGFASAGAALAAVLAATTDACAAEDVGKLCRPMRLRLDWAPGLPVEAKAEIGWLDPLPAGMFAAPPLTPASGG